MRGFDVLQSFGIIAALAMSATSLYNDFQDKSEEVAILQSEDGGGSFYLTGRGVFQEVNFDIINEGSNSIVIRNIKFSPNSSFPAPIFLDGQLWDGMPFTMTSKQIIIAQYRATRDFNYRSSEIKSALKLGQSVQNDFRQIIESIVPMRAVESRMKLILRPQDYYRLEYESFEAQEVQQQLFAKGLTFDGQHPDDAAFLKRFPMEVTLGGPCFRYLLHTLSVCTDLEVITSEGNSFVSQYLGYGLRSNELDELAMRDHT